MVKVIKSAEEFETVLSENDLVFVDFMATWCGPCKAMKPVIEEMSEEMKGKPLFLQVDIDQVPELTRKYIIRAVPTLILFEKKYEADRTMGLTTKQDIKKMICQIIEKNSG